MAIVWCRESVKDRRYEIASRNGGSASRSFLVRVDSPSESLSSISAEPGVSINDFHPDDSTLLCDKVSVRPRDDVGLLYEVSIDYVYRDPQAGDNNNNDEPGSMDGLVPFWGASSSVASEPIFKDLFGDIITNSAGDPLEGLEAERAQFHLTLTQYYPTHDGNDGWRNIARDYTNTINAVEWNGGAPMTWKCQGCSARLQIDRQGDNSAPRVYWEVSWDFAYRADRWVLNPWDIGFNELVDENGDPIEVYGGSGSGDGDGCDAVAGRRAILGEDNKPVRQPVALTNGRAKAACLKPDQLEFEVYQQMTFGPKFGELTTPVL